MDGKYIAKVGEKVQSFNEFLVRLINKTSDLKLSHSHPALPRTSTPLPRRKYPRGATDQENDPYSKFVKMLEEGRPSTKVRGMVKPPRVIVGGNRHLVQDTKRHVEEPKGMKSMKGSVYKPMVEFRCGR